MVYVTSFTLAAVLVSCIITLAVSNGICNKFHFDSCLVGSMLTLAVSNGMYNKFHFGSCSWQLYVNFSCELMCLHFFIQKYSYYVIVICPF